MSDINGLGEATVAVVDGAPPPAQLEASSCLDELSLHMGIELEFRNAHGQLIHPSAEVKRSLLTAMGLNVADDATVRAALDAVKLEAWRHPLPPVVVLGVQEQGLPIALPASTARIVWHLTLEDGTERQGHAEFSSLNLLESIEVGERKLQRRELRLPHGLPWGYHRLVLSPGGGSTSLIVTPGSCWLPTSAEKGERLWGVAAQLYLLRSNANWGIGDFGDLRSLIEIAAQKGAALLGLNPLHAMFHDTPEHASPYSPASRLLLNILYIEIPAIPELQDCVEVKALMLGKTFNRQLEACRSSPLVAYTLVTKLKLPILEKLYQTFREASTSARYHAFEAFRRSEGEALERSCLFLTLREHFSHQDPALADWRRWPDAYRNPESTDVRDFAHHHRGRVDFMIWMQWIADGQLADAAETAAAKGMPIGLYCDLAVGADCAGAETWSNAAAVFAGAHIGAPPDIFNSAGQDWGLPPFNPRALRAEGYRSFIELLRANMRHAGGLRIDHVMALQHLYLVPEGRKPGEGAYLKYPMADLVGILALESHRNRCLVVGEDLGTVPEGFRECMAAANILSYRVLFFEQDSTNGAFLPPESYPELALAVLGSHDLPTFRGWWEGGDLTLREQLSLVPAGAAAQAERETRRRDRQQLLHALADAREPSIDGCEPELSSLAVAAHNFLAKTRAMVAMVQVDDLTDEATPVNVPATDGEHPNWRRRLSLNLDELRDSPLWIAIAASFRQHRGPS